MSIAISKDSDSSSYNINNNSHNNSNSKRTSKTWYNEEHVQNRTLCIAEPSNSNDNLCHNSQHGKFRLYRCSSTQVKTSKDHSRNIASSLSHSHVTIHHKPS